MDSFSLESNDEGEEEIQNTGAAVSCKSHLRPITPPRLKLMRSAGFLTL